MENYGVNIYKARLVSVMDIFNYEDLLTGEVSNVSFWWGSAFDWNDMYLINLTGAEMGLEYNNNGFLWVRPVLEVPFSELGMSLDKFL